MGKKTLFPNWVVFCCTPCWERCRRALRRRCRQRQRRPRSRWARRSLTEYKEPENSWSSRSARPRIGFEPGLPNREEEEHLKALEAGGLSEIITCTELEPTSHARSSPSSSIASRRWTGRGPSNSVSPGGRAHAGVHHLLTRALGRQSRASLAASRGRTSPSAWQRPAGKADFGQGRTPKLSKTVAYSLQDQWPPGAAKPRSENYSAVLVKRFFKRLTRPRFNDGYALKRIGLIVLSEAQAATLGATLGATLITDASYTEFLSYLGTVARQLAHEYTGPVHAHAVAAWHAAASIIRCGRGAWQREQPRASSSCRRRTAWSDTRRPCCAACPRGGEHSPAVHERQGLTDL